jgi:general secretion pathway protein M
MKEWFLGLEQREQKLIGGGAIILLLLLLYSIIWEPIASAYTELGDSVRQQQETLAWMQQAAAQVKTLQRSRGGSAGGLAGRSLLAVVDQSARSGGLGNAIKRIEPDGSKGVKVWLEGAAFDPMILWLGKLVKSFRIEPSMITLEPIGGGRVNARLTLLEPAA